MDTRTSSALFGGSNPWPRPRSSWRLAAALLAVVVLGVTALAPGSARAGEAPGQGQLVAVGEHGDKPFTLEHTEVEMDVSPGAARVKVTQTYANPFETPLEAIYKFPLPHDAAVDRMAMIIGSRFIEAKIKRRQEAVEEYEEARDEGRHAALLEQEEDNLFTQSVANVMPGERILVTLSYVQPVVQEDGRYEIVFPMVVGPRYLPADMGDDDAVAHTVEVLPPDVRSGHDIDVTAWVDAGMPMAALSSPSHDVVVKRDGDRRATVTLARHERVPNKALVLRFETAADTPQLGFVTHRVGRDGFFALTLEPRADVPDRQTTPREMFFVVDTSGSMSGGPLAQVKAAIERSLKGMHPGDSFQIIRFSDRAASLATAPLENTPENVARGLAYLRGLGAGGGTEMMSGVRACLDAPADPERLRMVFFLTDGYIGNDDQIVAEVKRRLGSARLFSLGVGSDVNRSLLERMAEVGRGDALYVDLDDDPDDVVERFYARVSRPYLTDIEVRWGGLGVHDWRPSPIPDLFEGQPLHLVGRYDEPGTGTVTVTGRIAGRRWKKRIELTLPEEDQGHGWLPALWARRQIHHFSALLGPYDEDPEIVEKITELALAFDLMSDYTAFVAVERDVVANPSPEEQRTLLAAVTMPEGVSYEGIFGPPRETSASLAPQRFKPGDPEILVTAPRSAQRVFAVLPWGEEVRCTWEEDRGGWLGRFLVPREADEGVYRVPVFVLHADGTPQEIDLAYRVDRSAPVMELELPDEVLYRGEEIGVEARPIDHVYEGRAVRGAGDLVVKMRADVLRAVVRLGDAVFELEQTRDRSRWAGSVTVPEDWEPGEHEVVLVVTDRAGNVYEQRTTVTIIDGDLEETGC